MYHSDRLVYSRYVWPCKVTMRPPLPSSVSAGMTGSGLAFSVLGFFLGRGSFLRGWVAFLPGWVPRMSPGGGSVASAPQQTRISLELGLRRGRMYPPQIQACASLHQLHLFRPRQQLCSSPPQLAASSERQLPFVLPRQLPAPGRQLPFGAPPRRLPAPGLQSPFVPPPQQLPVPGRQLRFGAPPRWLPFVRFLQLERFIDQPAMLQIRGWDYRPPLRGALRLPLFACLSSLLQYWIISSLSL